MSGKHDSAVEREEWPSPDSDHDRKFWYLAGFGAATLIIGVTGMLNYRVEDPHLAMIGAIIFAGCTLYQVIYRD